MCTATASSGEDLEQACSLRDAATAEVATLRMQLEAAAGGEELEQSRALGVAASAELVTLRSQISAEQGRCAAAEVRRCRLNR